MPTDAQLQLARTVLELVTPGFLAVIAWYQKRHNARTEAAAKKVSDTLAVTTAQTAQALGSIKQTTEATKVLVNHKYGLALRLAADLAQRIALLTGLSEDVKAANAAENSARVHDAKQADLDRYKSDLENK